MKEKTNLFPSLIRLRETSRLKMAIAASIMLWCATPQQATADTNEEHAIEAVQQAKVKVKGTVVDETGEPMIGVAVKVLANNTGTITDLEGKFSVEAPLGGAIQISFVGYKTVTVKASSEPISVTLKEDSQQLDEVVVVGYGSQKKVNVTGSVSMVDSKVIESRPVQNVSQALQGVVPGLNMSVGNSGGALDSSLSINIRGAGTIGEGSSGSPLVLIDGIEGDMNTVNPNDIENISVLKDAASSSIYGARASFGVIMITTKSGKSGKTRVNYSGNVRFSDAIQIPEWWILIPSHNTSTVPTQTMEEVWYLTKRPWSVLKTIRQGNTPTRTLLNTMERRPVMTENGKTIQVPSPTQTGLKSSIKIGYPQQSTI